MSGNQLKITKHAKKQENINLNEKKKINQLKLTQN